MIFYGSRNALRVTGLINDIFLTEKSTYFINWAQAKKKRQSHDYTCVQLIKSHWIDLYQVKLYLQDSILFFPYHRASDK